MIKSCVEGSMVSDGEAEEEDVGCDQLGGGRQLLQVTGKYGIHDLDSGVGGRRCYGEEWSVSRCCCR